MAVGQRYPLLSLSLTHSLTSIPNHVSEPSCYSFILCSTIFRTLAQISHGSGGGRRSTPSEDRSRHGSVDGRAGMSKGRRRKFQCRVLFLSHLVGHVWLHTVAEAFDRFLTIFVLKMSKLVLHNDARALSCT